MCALGCVLLGCDLVAAMDIRDYAWNGQSKAYNRSRDKLQWLLVLPGLILGAWSCLSVAAKPSASQSHCYCPVLTAHGICLAALAHSLGNTGN